MIKGNGDTSFILDTLDEGEESFLNSPYGNNGQNKIFDADAAAELREGDGADEEGLVVQGPPSVVRVGSASRSDRKNGSYAPDASSGSVGDGMSNLRTPNMHMDRTGAQNRLGRNSGRSGGHRVSDSKVAKLYPPLTLFFVLSLLVEKSLMNQTSFPRHSPQDLSSSRSHAKSNCPFCKREVHSQQLSAHLLRCRRQQASRDKVWRDAKIRHTEGTHAVAHAHARRERHALASTPSSATRLKK